MAVHQFSFPTQIHFGPGARNLLGAHLLAAGVKRPLIVTDCGVAALPLAGELSGALSRAGLAPALFPEVATTLVNTAEPAEFFILNPVILKACQPLPADRYDSAAQLRLDLEAIQNNAGHSAR